MKKIVLFSLLILCNINLIAQKETKNLDFIITIDDSILTQRIVPTIILKDKMNNVITSFKTKYHPGNLSFDKLDFEKLGNSDIENIEMKFQYSEICNGKTKNYDYLIKVKNDAFKGYFFIVKIINVNKKKYKKMYLPIKGKNYNYVYITSEKSETLTLRRTKKNQCY